MGRVRSKAAAERFVISLASGSVNCANLLPGPTQIGARREMGKNYTFFDSAQLARQRERPSRAGNVTADATSRATWPDSTEMGERTSRPRTRLRRRRGRVHPQEMGESGRSRI
jgi:hypothetical protein